MSGLMERLLERFPDFDEVIHDLIGSNDTFDRLCHEYSEVAQRLDAASDVEPEGEDLATRKSALEEEMLAIMQANVRV